MYANGNSYGMGDFPELSTLAMLATVLKYGKRF
jgi:hypothetical protein